MEFDSTGFPLPFLKRMEKMLEEEYTAFLKSFALGSRYFGLRVNPLKLTPEEFLLRHGKDFSSPLTAVPWAKGGFYYGPQDHPGKSPLHEAGLYYIQEPSAMSAAEALDIKPEESPAVLDLCAAPGGKASQIAGKLGGRGILIANEINPSRAKILSQNIERMGIMNAVVTNEPPKRLAERFPAAFDRILVDAPCSGEGMYRKNDAALTEWSEENVKMCAERQAEILSCAAKLLAPGGRLVYSTCTFSPDEDEETAARFLYNHPEFTLADTGLSGFFSPGRESFLGEGIPAPDGLYKTIRVWPHEIKGEGHFIAAFTKSADTCADGVARPAFEYSGNTPLTKEQQKLFSEFADASLSESGKKLTGSGNFALFGGELYMLPGKPGITSASFNGIKVLRCGLHMGSFLKNRFEPAHALAIAFKPENFKRAAIVSMECAERYLRGETLDIACEKGWLPAVLSENGGNYPLGWCKSDGKKLKNHYPKGLRRV